MIYNALLVAVAFTPLLIALGFGWSQRPRDPWVELAKKDRKIHA